MIVTLTNYQPEARYDGLPWTDARIEEAASASGPWEALETIPLNPVDPDPTTPAARSFTTTAATLAAGWYRVVWVDAAMLESATSPVRNTLPFATSDEFAARLGITLTEAEAARVDTLLAFASGLIQQETKQDILLVSDDVWTVRSEWGDRIRLPERPVVSVASVTLTPQSGDAVTLDANTYYVDGDELVRASFPIHYQRFFENWTRGWLGPLYTLTVTYTHGFAVVPPLVKTICLEAAVRAWVNPGAVVQESIAGVTTIYAPFSKPPTGLRLTDDEKTELVDTFGRPSGSIQLR